jgi:lipoprotein NlpD
VKRTWLAALALVPALVPAMSSAPAAAAPPIIAWTYTVQPGDTLAAVAARMGISAAALARTNRIDPDARLIAGTVLKRPDPADMPTAAKRAPRRAPAAPRTMPITRAPVQPRALPEPVHAATPGTPRLIWPTSGAVTTRFGARVHGVPANGIDLAAFAGMTVRAAAAGTVIFAGTEPERFGQLIVIDHGKGWATAYAYLGKVVIGTGAKVHAGEAIARIGASGEAKKPTLHFELRRDNVPQDPVAALPVRL